MKLTNNSKTLFIPLYCKAKMSKKNWFLKDKKAEEIVSNMEYDFTALKISKWLSMFISLRSLIIDELVSNYISKKDRVTILHLGCGLDSRCIRIHQTYNKWYDVDYKEVIDIRNDFYKSNSKYQMISSSVVDYRWLDNIKENENILVIAEGLSMYLSEDELKELLFQINQRFNKVYFIFDAYTKKGVKLSKIKNPVNQFNAEVKYGFNNPEELCLLHSNLKHVATHVIKKDRNDLKGITKFIFNKLYCGKISQSLYKIYEFEFK